MDSSESDLTSTLKDVVLTSLLMLAISGLAYAYRQYQNSQCYLKKIISDIEGLSKAEETLKTMQDQLQRRNSKLQQQQQCETSEMSHDRTDCVSASVPSSNLEVSRLREEIEILRSELHQAEIRLEDRSWTAPMSLQHWLTQTYEQELQVYNDKKKSAEQQLDLAKEMCEKLKKKRLSLVGAFVSTHSGSIGDVDRSILEAKSALMEVTQDLTERTQRWRQIEILCGFSILSSQQQSQTSAANQPRLGSSSRMSSSFSQEDSYLDDIMTSYDDSGYGGSPLARHSLNSLKHVSRESSKESSSSDEIQDGRMSGVKGALRRISSSSSFSLPPLSPFSQTPSPSMQSSRRLMPKVGPGGRMMVKSFSQDGYSSMSNSPYVLRGRGMSAAASNEALEEAMRTSVSETYLQSDRSSELGNFVNNSNATSTSSMAPSELMKDEGCPQISTEEGTCDVTEPVVVKTKSKMFFNFGSKKEKQKDII